MKPFNIDLLKITPRTLAALMQVRSQDTFEGATKNFHPEGLFSTVIFGRTGEDARMRRFGYIDLKLPILHPLVLRVLDKLKRIYPQILAGKTFATWDPVLKDFIKSDALSGSTGYHFFMQHFAELDLKTGISDLRELNVKFINRVRTSSLVDKVIVAPAGFRDFVIHPDGREEEDEVNGLYRKLLRYANAVPKEGFAQAPANYDRTRASMQEAFNAIYTYFEAIFEGKNKLLVGKWLTRSIHYGTRNVITSQNLRTKELFSPAAPKFNDTGIGLLQYLKAFQPVVMYQIRNGFVSEVFTSPQAPARLVNTATLEEEDVILASDYYDSWMTSEGLERLIGTYAEEETRHQPIVIEGRYLGLIYKDDKNFRLMHSLSELPNYLDKAKVSPVTPTELYYIAVYPHTSKYALNVTRYPVTGFGSIYPSKCFLRPTMAVQTLTPLNENWEVDKDAPVAYNFPVRGSAFVNSMMPAPNKLAGLGAD